MGLKDLFGGGKKEAEFLEKAKVLLSDGRLVPGKAEAIAKTTSDDTAEVVGGLLAALMR